MDPAAKFVAGAKLTVSHAEARTVALGVAIDLAGLIAAPWPALLTARSWRATRASTNRLTPTTRKREGLERIVSLPTTAMRNLLERLW